MREKNIYIVKMPFLLILLVLFMKTCLFYEDHIFKVKAYHDLKRKFLKKWSLDNFYTLTWKKKFVNVT